MTIRYIKSPDIPLRACSLCGVTNKERYIKVKHPKLAALGLPEDTALCGPCFRAQAEKAGIKLHPIPTDFTAHTSEQLKAIGLSKVERRADLAKVPDAILCALPEGVATPILAGQIPLRNGFGLAGPGGTGKTSALAALLVACVEQNAQNLAPFKELEPVRSIHWMRWPASCHQWRLNGLHWSVEREINRAKSSRLLILDDLGRETRRREAAEDVATGHLDMILTHRDGEDLPTLWTSNLSEDELANRYGFSMIRRLLRLNPMVQLTDATFHPEAL